MRNLIFCILFLLPTSLIAKNAEYYLFGSVSDAATQKPLAEAQVFLEGTASQAFTDEKGRYKLGPLKPGKYKLVAFYYGKQSKIHEVEVKNKSVELHFLLTVPEATLDAVNITASREATFGMGQFASVEGVSIYEGKKAELIVLEDLTANKASNNPRQIYGRVPGLNIWESDGAGIQLGIGARGLSPNRTSNFNTRQNGYDISADALGYPESYYTPPAEALARIEVVRGAASLQYGTQFGGMLNFIFKEAPEDKKFHFETRQSVGSFGFFNSFNRAAGTVGKVKYNGYYQFKRGDGWRENAGFDLHNVFTQVEIEASKKLKIRGEYTFMHYLAQQPGGLTDVLFEENPRQSLRERNWFLVDWNLLALTADYEINSSTKFNLRTFHLHAQRQALGNLSRINVVDFNENRTLIRGQFQNYGAEARLLHRYQLLEQQSVFLIGTRYYQGQTLSTQGDGNASADPDFYFLNPERPENSDYLFPSHNLSFFAENIFRLHKKFSLTPGVRVEHIGTFSEGYYRQVVKDAAGNIVAEQTQEEELRRVRAFPLFGLGATYRPNEKHEIYANISQNYRAINFNDLRIVNPSFQIDPDIYDEKGYTADLGWRWLGEHFKVDASLFYLRYDDRIGLVLRADEPPLYLPYRYRTNVADAQTLGIELFTEYNFLPELAKSLHQRGHNFVGFMNLSLVHAEYMNSDEPAIEGKKVELVPPVSLRFGINYSTKKFSSALQYSYVHEHFTDATNARREATAVNGLIPSYQVWDFSVGYRLKHWQFEGSVNNLLDARYFTRRASGYPGPGIIPADGRSFFFTVGYSL